MKSIYFAVLFLFASLAAMAQGPILGSTTFCQGSTVTLSNSVAGGSWSSSNPTIASIDATTGECSGNTYGSAYITYSVGTGTVTAMVNINPLPNGSVSGGGSYCFGDTSWTGFHVFCNLPHPTNYYQLYFAGSPVGGPVPGTGGSSIDFGTFITSGVYTVMATNAITGCSAWMDSSASITSYASPTTYAVVGGGSYCSGSPGLPVSISGSSSGVLYQLYLGGTPVSSPLPGTGSALFFGLQTTPGSYSVYATHVATGCTSRMFGTATINSVAAPSTYAVSGGGGYCSGGPGLPIGLAASDSTISYQLYNGSTAVGTALAGTGTALSFGTFTTPGTYSVAAANAGCTISMAGTAIIYTISTSCSGLPAPGSATSRNVTICSGNNIVLGLSGALTCGTTYQWQSSSSGSSWSAISGATTATYSYSPTSTLYYRCLATCISSGLSAFSSPVFVRVTAGIRVQQVLEQADTVCNGFHFMVTACSYSAHYKVVTSYGDGIKDTNLLTGSGSPYASIRHLYVAPGTYTIKQLLYDSTTLVDSASFSYEYVPCSYLPVKFYYDHNTNCRFDSTDTYIQQPTVTRVDSNGITVATISGTSGFYYRAMGSVGTVYTFSVIGTPDGLLATCPSGGVIRDTIQPLVSRYPVRFVGMSCTGTGSFNLQTTLQHRSSPTRAIGSFAISNPYCTAPTPLVKFSFSPRYRFDYGYPAPDSVVGNSAYWTLAPVNMTATKTVYFVLSAPTALSLGDTVHYGCQVGPFAGDADTTNNKVQQVDSIRASYDPNDIAVSPEGLVIPCTPLLYTVRFENTGNDTAHNIYVLDTLANTLDASTLEVEYASATMNIVRLDNGGHTIVKFDFPNIKLLDSSHHGLCDGMFRYRIKTKPGLTDGTVIPARVGIYFDVNDPIITNTATNTIGIHATTGPDSVCQGTTILLANASQGGIWATTNPLATVAAGRTTGVLPGLDTVLYTVSNTCGFRQAQKVVTILPQVTPSLLLATATGPLGPLCASITTFTVSPVHGGTAPRYQWLVNGTRTGTGSSYSYLPTDGDVVAVELTSNALCATPDTASQRATLEVRPLLIPALSIAASPGTEVARGQTTTFTATASFAGTSPAYQWVVNTTPVPGATTTTYVTDTLHHGDSVSCQVVTTGDCGGYSSFNSIKMEVSSVGLATYGQAGSITLFPNPASGTITLSGQLRDNDGGTVVATITNMVGQVVYTLELTPTAGRLQEQVHLPASLPSGNYTIRLQHSQGTNAIHFAVAR